jgi:hypothetical protein
MLCKQSGNIVHSDLESPPTIMLLTLLALFIALPSAVYAHEMTLGPGDRDVDGDCIQLGLN